MLGSKAADGLCSVLVNPANEIVRDTEVGCSILSAREDIDVVAHDYRSHP